MFITTIHVTDVNSDFLLLMRDFSRTMIWASGFKNTSQRSTGTTRIRSGSPTGPITAPRVGPFKGVTGSKRQSSNVSQMTCLPSPLGALIRLRTELAHGGSGKGRITPSNAGGPGAGGGGGRVQPPRRGVRDARGSDRHSIG